MDNPTHIEHDRRTAAELFQAMNDTDEYQHPDKFIELHAAWIEKSKEEKGQAK